jgi:hypothetical protein
LSAHSRFIAPASYNLINWQCLKVILRYLLRLLPELVGRNPIIVRVYAALERSDQRTDGDAQSTAAKAIAARPHNAVEAAIRKAKQRRYRDYARLRATGKVTAGWAHALLARPRVKPNPPPSMTLPASQPATIPTTTITSGLWLDKYINAALPKRLQKSWRHPRSSTLLFLGADAECKAPKEEFKDRGLVEVAGEHFTVTRSEQFSRRLDVSAVKVFLEAWRRRAIVAAGSSRFTAPRSKLLLQSIGQRVGVHFEAD